MASPHEAKVTTNHLVTAHKPSSGARARTSSIQLQRLAFYQLNYPRRSAPRYPRRHQRQHEVARVPSLEACRAAARVASLMGSLIKKRRKRMRKKKHKKMLKRTRWQRRAAGK
jgi:Mitochondrial mRNA-processing protein COX24, C-terminal